MDDDNAIRERNIRADEADRCARLCEARGDISRVSAHVARRKGAYRTIFGRERILPEYRKLARDLDAVAEAFDMVADCMRKGYELR